MGAKKWPKKFSESQKKEVFGLVSEGRKQMI